MNRLGTRTLYTDDCCLRELSIADAKQLYGNVFSDEKTAQYMSWKRYENEDAVHAYLTKWQDRYKEAECYWGIFTMDTDTLVGTVYLSEECAQAEIATLSYCLGSKFWGRGYMTQSIRAVLEYAFDALQYRMITAFCAQSNRASQKVLTCLGFQYEATLRQRDKTAFGYEDCLQYSILAEEMVR